jgi:hypothetical protein
LRKVAHIDGTANQLLLIFRCRMNRIGPCDTDPISVRFAERVFANENYGSLTREIHKLQAKTCKFMSPRTCPAG